MPQEARRGVALGGFMGTGKTTVGARLAGRLGVPFVDMDAVLVERYGPIALQFGRDGEGAFRARESLLVSELCDGVPRVVATGGGAWVSRGNRDRLRQHYQTVVLEAPLEELVRRVGEGTGRPLWTDAAGLLAARKEAYADADLVLDTADQPVDGVVEQIAVWMATREAEWTR